MEQKELKQEDENTNVDPLHAPVGTKEIPVLGKAEAKILDVSLVPKKEGKYSLLELYCRHPDRPDDLLKITKVKMMFGNNVRVQTLWLNQDDEGNIQKGSSIAQLLTFVGADSISDLATKTVMLIPESESVNYLVVKCYD